MAERASINTPEARSGTVLLSGQHTPHTERSAFGIRPKRDMLLYPDADSIACPTRMDKYTGNLILLSIMIRIIHPHIANNNHPHASVHLWLHP